MATYLHFAPAVALAVAVGLPTVGWRLMLVGAACAVVPDADFLLVMAAFRQLQRYLRPQRVHTLPGFRPAGGLDRRLVARVCLAFLATARGRGPVPGVVHRVSSAARWLAERRYLQCLVVATRWRTPLSGVAADSAARWCAVWLGAPGPGVVVDGCAPGVAGECGHGREGLAAQGTGTLARGAAASGTDGLAHRAGGATYRGGGSSATGAAGRRLAQATAPAHGGHAAFGAGFAGPPSPGR